MAPGSRTDAIRVIRRSSEHLSGLVEGLLDISRIETEQFSLVESEIWLEAFLIEIVEMFHLESAAREIDFVFKPGENLPVAINANEKRLRQILINLLSNAFKFTLVGQVTLSIKRIDKVLEYNVKDTGVGITPGDIERIFEPFERIVTAAPHTVQGTGLGLPISKLLTEHMGGQISIQSEPGVGSEFTVRMPIDEVSEPRKIRKGERPIVGYRGRRRSVVVTDDHEEHCQLIKDILQPIGFDLHSASNAEECLWLSRHHDIDLYLLDISMPGMDGMELASALREIPGMAAPIMMISANAVPSAQDTSRPDNHTDYLMKPIQYDRFLEKIQSALDVEWMYQGMGTISSSSRGGTEPSSTVQFPMEDIRELKDLGQIGHIRGIRVKLDELDISHPEHQLFVENLRGYIDDFQLPRFMAALEKAGASHDG